jgi:hypothetical protein
MEDDPIVSLLEWKERLRRLSKADREVLRLHAADLAVAYHEQRLHAPRRAQGYFSPSRNGVTSSREGSNRAEEILAAGLFRQGVLSLPNGDRLTILDYQFPLKSVRADAGIGKVDLLGLFEDNTLAVVELKVAKNREDRRIALLEGLIYAAIIERNIEQIAEEACAAKRRRVLQTRPRVLLIAPANYWTDSTSCPSTGEFEMLISEVARAIPLEITALCLNDANLTALGLNDREPQVNGLASVSPVTDDTDQKVGSRAMSHTAYRDNLHRRFWDYARTSFAADDGVLDPKYIEGKDPPVFRREFADRNVLVPPTADPNVLSAIMAMTPAKDRHPLFASMKSSQALAQSVFAGLAALGRLDALQSFAAEDGHPAFFERAAEYRVRLEHQVSTLGEPRPTSLDAFFEGPRKVAVEVKFTEKEFGSCSRPSLRSVKPNFTRDHCDGSFSVQRNRTARCSLSEQGILYWQFVPRIFTWSGTQEHRPCPLALTYQLVRNVLAVCVGEDGILDTNVGHVLVLYDERNPAFQSGGDADAAWRATVDALRYARLLRRVSWQRMASHLGQFPDLSWLTAGLEDKYGIVASSK